MPLPVDRQCSEIPSTGNTSLPPVQYTVTFISPWTYTGFVRQSTRVAPKPGAGSPMRPRHPRLPRWGFHGITRRKPAGRWPAWARSNTAATDRKAAVSIGKLNYHAQCFVIVLSCPFQSPAGITEVDASVDPLSG